MGIRDNKLSSSFIVGLTGGIGSGKSSAANIFAQLGAYIIDTDSISHALTAPNGEALAAIATAFPDVVDNHVLNRSRLRDQVFSDHAAKLRLETILHPMIRAETERRLHSPASLTAVYTVLVVPLLFESNTYRDLIACACVVDIPETLQIERVTQTRNISADTVRQIITSQLARQERLAKAQFIIDNSTDQNQLAQQVSALHRVFTANAATLKNQCLPLGQDCHS